jgi:hypothetical protein
MRYRRRVAMTTVDVGAVRDGIPPDAHRVVLPTRRCILGCRLEIRQGKVSLAI